MGRVIVISGSPGVGKTTVAKALAERMKGYYLNLSELVLKEKLYMSRDEERDTLIIDEDKVKDRIVEISREHELVVIDSHYGEIVPPQLLEAIIILRLNPGILWRKLEERGWSRRKIVENVEAELLGVCTSNALSSYPEDKVLEIDVTGKNVEEVVGEILECLGSTKCRGLRVDWTLRLHQEEVEELLRSICKLRSQD